MMYLRNWGPTSSPRSRRHKALGIRRIVSLRTHSLQPGSTVSSHRVRIALCAAALSIALLSGARAQQAIIPSPVNQAFSIADLPDAPGVASFPQATTQSTSAQSAGSISGTVMDTNGAVVAGAQVTVTAGQSDTGHDSLKTDEQGRFTQTNLSPGTFRITISSAGLKTFVSEPIVLAAGENLQLPAVILRVNGTSADVQVMATQQEIAQAQVQEAEKQRVLGIVPNFYSSYIWTAAPLTPKLKFGLALRSTLDPVDFMIAGGVAGVEQWHNTFPGYGRGTDGYLKRYGAAYADNFIGRMVGSALLPSLFHQDPRYFYKGKGSVTSRALYAISQTVIARGDNGRSEPNYSHVLGNFAAAGISNLYRSSEDRNASLTVRNGFIITGANAIGNLVREFLLKGITSKVPDYAKGKP